MLPRLALAVGLLSFVSLGGCDKPAPPPAPTPPMVTERRPLIVSDEAPFLVEAEDDEGAAAIGRAGEVVELIKELGTLKWEAALGDRTGKRDGRLIEVRQAPGDAILFGWKGDLGPEVDVPTTAWICDAIARDPAIPASAKLPSCPDYLRRIRMPDGAFVAYQMCSQGPSPIAIVRGGHVGAIAVEGMVLARSVPSKGGLALLATTRWVRDAGTWTGGNLVPIKLTGPAPVALAPVPLDEIDARGAAKVMARVVHVAIEGVDRLAIHLVGERRENALADGHVLTHSPIDETIPISDL